MNIKRKAWIIGIVIALLMILWLIPVNPTDIEPAEVSENHVRNGNIKPEVIEEGDAALKPSNVSQIVDRPALPEQMPEDFEFSLKYGVDSKGSVDTFSNEITKDLVEDGTESTSFEMPDEMKSEFYDMLKHIHIEQYPKDFQSPYKYKFVHKTKAGMELGGASHYSSYILTYRLNGKLYTVNWNDQYLGQSTEDLMGDELFEVLIGIIRYVEDSEEFKSLPEISGGYA